MKKLILFAMAALIFTACHKEEKEDSSNVTGGTVTTEIIKNAVTDIDGNTYNAVRIGNQVWMAENLRTTRYADSTLIAYGDPLTYSTPNWYYPNDDFTKKSTYGLLYNWKAVMRNATSSSSNPSGVQGICPNGWHVPSDAEWTQLTNYVSSQSQYSCGGDPNNIAKALSATTGWDSHNASCCVGNAPGTNNATGFNALPAGLYYTDGTYFSYEAFFYSATEDSIPSALVRNLSSNSEKVYRYAKYKSYGLSVRCVRN